MARFPSLSAPAQTLRESVFARLAGGLAAASERGEVFPLHIGDTHRAPPPAARLSARDDLDDPALFRYGSPAGETALLDALADKCRRRNGLSSTDRASILVTGGATLALSCAVRALLDPGDELLLFSPYWPLIHGITTGCGAIPVEVEITQRLYADPAFDLHAALTARATPRTRALYLITPNNPDGKVLDRAALETVARFARERDLWVIADEVYEDLLFGGAHTSIASLPGMAERTVTAFSLSKSYALAGYRLGYTVADPRVIHALRKLQNHAVYNVPAVLQRAGLGALMHAGGWMEESRAAYRILRDLASAKLPQALAPHFVPDGGAYLFLDLSRQVGALGGGEAGVSRLHDRLIAAGVALAPGSQFGSAYTRYARLCYTAIAPERLAAGITRLAETLAALSP